MSGAESDPSMTFRMHPLEEEDDDDDDDDHCKTIIKIEHDRMEKLQIREGDIVQVTGKDKAVAFCFSLTQKELKKARSQDIPIEYLNPYHKEIEYPAAVSSNVVFSNACPYRHTRLVKIEKMPTKSLKDAVPEAQVVALGTVEFAEKLMPDYKANVDFSALFGRLIKKEERINIPFLPDYTKQQQQQRAEKKDTKRRRARPMKFSSLIVNAKPENSEFWTVTKNTRFEFQSIPMSKLRGKIPELCDVTLLKVVPIVKKMHLQDTDVTLASIDVFEDAMTLRWYTQQRIKLPGSFPSNISKFRDLNVQAGSPELTIEINDDLGNIYSDGFVGSRGGGSSPDPSTSEIVSYYSGECRFYSTLDPRAKEITVIVKDITWIKRGRSRMQARAPKTGFMSPLHDNPKLSVLEGPWEFKIRNI